MHLLERVLGGPNQQTEHRDSTDRFELGSPYESFPRD